MPAKKTIQQQQQMRHFGLWVLAVRMELGLAAKELAARAGIDHTTLWRIENGQQDPGLTVVYKLADALELELCVLLCQCSNCNPVLH